MPLYSETCKRRLDGKVIVITGANTGIGKIAAHDFSKRGAKVIIACRTMDKGKAAAQEIMDDTGNPVEVEKLDLSDLSSVKECAESLKGRLDRIDVLLNNAGVMNTPNWKTKDGFDMQFGTNHLGHFMFTHLLLPLLKKTGEENRERARIVNVASYAHEMGSMNWEDMNWEKNYDPVKAYAQSKLANIMHAKALARRLNEEGAKVNVYALHPGVIKTDLYSHTNNRWWGKIIGTNNPLNKLFYKTPMQGAQTSIYCSIEPKLEDKSGLYYSCTQKEQNPIAQARNVDDQDRLWRMSEKFVGISS